MRKESCPMLSDWAALLKAALQFNETACWEWMGEADGFYLCCPETGEDVYAVVMGEAGIVHGLAIYPGREGDAGLEMIYLHEAQGGFSDFHYRQTTLHFSMGDRQEVRKEERDIYKKLGYSFRGKAGWPCFDSMRPGRPMQGITQGECHLLTAALDQVLEVALVQKSGKNIIHRHDKSNKYLRRIPQKNLQGEISWVNDYFKPEKTEFDMPAYQITDELLLRRLLALPKNEELSVEAEISYLPALINEKGQDLYPLLMVVVECKNGLIAGQRMLLRENDGVAVLDCLRDSLNALQARPGKIYIQHFPTFIAIEEVCQQLDIELIRVEELIHIGEIHQMLSEGLAQG